MSNNKGKLEIKRVVSIALMTAVICVLSPFAIVIPISPVPITFATFAIFVTVIILGWKAGTISVIVYVLLGFAGVPVFTGFSGGVVKVLGPTGGYIIGYIFLAFIEGSFVKKAQTSENVKVSFANITIFVGMLIGTIVLYVFGTLWLAKQANMSLVAAFTAGVIPFVVGDVVKMAAALFVGTKIRNALVKCNLL